MEMTIRLSYILLLVPVILGSDDNQRKGVKLDLPPPWSRSEIQQRQKKLADRYSRPSGGNARHYVVPFDQNLDAKEWLEMLLTSLVEEPLTGGSSEPRSPSGQRIFQREARPHLSQANRNPSTSNKRRFSLSSVRVNPQSLKRQSIYPPPKMGLVRLEDPVKFRSTAPAFKEKDSYLPQPAPVEVEQQPPSYEDTPYQEGEQQYPDNQNYGPDVVTEEQRPRVINVDVYVKYHP